MPTINTNVQSPLTSQFSATTLAAALCVVGSGAAVGLAVVPRIGTVVGMLAGGMILGAAGTTRPLTEGAVAAVVAQLVVLAAAGVPGAGLSGAAMALSSVGLGSLGLSLASSAAAGGFGVHLGDDLRDGLTTPINDTASHERMAPPPREAVVDSNRSSSEQGSPPDTEPERETIRESADE
jgi:hypothetical protein